MYSSIVLQQLVILHSQLTDTTLDDRSSVLDRRRGFFSLPELLWSFRSRVAEDSVLLLCDSASVGNQFAMFRSRVVASRIYVSSKRRTPTTQWRDILSQKTWFSGILPFAAAPTLVLGLSCLTSGYWGISQGVKTATGHSFSPSTDVLCPFPQAESHIYASW